MSGRDDIREALKRMGNPYAKLSIVDDGAETVAEARRQYIRRLQNPYATLDVATDLPSTPTPPVTVKAKPLATVAPSARGGLSKVDFAARCRAIFLSYMPMREDRTSLRPEYRAFIAENGDRSAHVRLAVVNALERYALEPLGNITPHLNREREPDLIRKLKSITDSVSG